MIKIDYEILRGLIKEYVLYNHDVVVDDTYTIDFNGTEVEIGKVRMIDQQVSIDKIIKDSFKVFEETQLKIEGKL